MNASSQPSPIEKHVVLVGAGNAHLGFVRRFGMMPVERVAVTLVSEAPVIPYSAMVPGYIAGDYTWDDITIDLVRLCQASKVRFVAGRVQALEVDARQIRVAGRPPLTFDALSLGVGSLPTFPVELADADNSLTIRPMTALARKLDALEESLTTNPRPFHFVVVGGGASGCELTLAIHKRLQELAGFRITLLQGDPSLLPSFPEGTMKAFAKVFQERNIAVRVDARVTGADSSNLLIQGGERIAFDAVLWATQAAPSSWLRNSGLVVDAAGFLKVLPTLQTTSDPAIFGTGDCVDFEAYPDLPKNGVHAVRQGAVLFDNIAAFLHEEPLRPFEPQRYCLCLMNSADGQAILNYGLITWKGKWVRRWKDRIDRRWIQMHTPAFPSPHPERGAGSEGTVPGEENYLMRCGGCGSKISSDVLSAVLKRIDLPDDPRIVLGTKAGEDAAVHRVNPALFSNEPTKLLEVQTVDYFKAFIDDPYLFGRIAAQHAVSDLYAMNARPFSALAIATLPYARGPIQEAQLYELLSGAVETLRANGMVLTGGHTTEGAEMALGFSVTGFADEGKLFQKSKLRAGDVLILTKPIGTGAILAAWMRGACKAQWFEPLIAAMFESNRAAAEIFAQAGVVACTDITGFGLAGHLLEMLDASGVSARLNADKVPLYAGFNDVVAAGIVSSLQRDNAKMACRVASTNPPAWLFDPQTSGGLLVGVAPELAEDIVRRLRDVCKHAAIIGHVTSDAAPLIYV
jgi:selenide,water dikinase